MNQWKTSAKNQFDGWSKKYDRSILQRIFFKPTHDKMIAALEIESGDRVLDAGCGTGRFMFRLLQENEDLNVVGLDISDQMLNHARENGKVFGDRLELVQADSEHIPFDDNSFDAITCIHSFHHYPNQGLCLREFHRVLRPGGQLLVVDGNRDGAWGRLVFDGVVATVEGHVHHNSGWQFRNMYQAAGFGDIRQIKGGTIAPFLITVGRAEKMVGTQPRQRNAA